MDTDKIFDEIYVDESERLTGFVYKRMGSIHDADDIIQEAWLRLYKALQSTEIHNPKGWIYRVARNLIIDYHKKKSRGGYLTGNDSKLAQQATKPDFQYYDHTSNEDLSEVLKAAMNKLSDKHRQVVEQIDLNGKTYREFAEESNINMGTLLSRNFYAKVRLKEYLQYFYEEFFLKD